MVKDKNKDKMIQILADSTTESLRVGNTVPMLICALKLLSFKFNELKKSFCRYSKIGIKKRIKQKKKILFRYQTMSLLRIPYTKYRSCLYRTSPPSVICILTLFLSLFMKVAPQFPVIATDTCKDQKKVITAGNYIAHAFF